MYIYGPPAVGKLTVARRVQELTGFRLFHNHLTVNALVEVFDFNTLPFAEVLHRLRLDVFETAARTGVDVTFTNNSIWAGDNDGGQFVAFARHAAHRVRDAGGSTRFVRLTAPNDVLCDRVADDSRRAMGKLVDPVLLRSRLAQRDAPVVHGDDLVIDTSTVSTEEASHQIARALS